MKQTNFSDQAHVPTALFYLHAEDATWTCATCGEVPPYFSRCNKRYVKSSCLCQKRAAREVRDQREWQQRQESLVQHTYQWLGSGWSDRDLAQKTFANFDHNRQPEGHEAAEVFSMTLEGTLILHGPYGTGKTHLLAAVCNRLRENGRSSCFTSAPNLFAAIGDAMNHDGDYHRLIKIASTCPLLALDDIGNAKWSEFREEQYFAIIDGRVKRGLPTAISINLLSDLTRIVGGAVESRLSIGQVAVAMVGQDYRRGL